MNIKIKCSLYVALLTGCYLSAFVPSLLAADRSQADRERDLRSKPQRVIEFAKLKSGDKVLDFLGGGGYYSEIIAEAVGESGEVTLHNNQAYMPYVGKELTQRFKHNKRANLHQVISEAADLKLGVNRFDKIFFIMGYHDLYHLAESWDVTADKVLPQLNQALKKGGEILIIDHQAKSGSGKSSAQLIHRIESQFVIEDMSKRGFELVKQSDILLNAADPLDINVFDPSLGRNTSRFVLLFKKIAEQY